MMVRRRDIPFAFEATTIPAITAREVTARMDKLAMTSMRVMPLGLVFMASCPEEPAEEARGRLADAVHRRCADLDRLRRGDVDLLVGHRDDLRLTAGVLRDEDRSTCSAGGVRERAE